MLMYELTRRHQVGMVYNNFDNYSCYPAYSGHTGLIVWTIEDGLCRSFPLTYRTTIHYEYRASWR